MLLRIVTIMFLLIVLPGSISQARGSKKKITLQSEGKAVLETLQSFYPVKATESGIHSYDHRLADYSSRSVKGEIKKLKRHLKNLKRLENHKLSPSEQIDLKLLQSNVKVAILDLDKIKWHKKLPQLYVDEAVQGVYSLMRSRHAPLSERLYSIISRMKEVPSLFSLARKNIRQPPDIWVELGKESIESGISFYQQAASELMNKFPDRANEILKVSTKAREAMNDFLVYLDEIKRGEDNAFAVGKENFNYLLTHEYFLPFDSDSLIKIGESLLAQARVEYSEYESYVEERHQNGLDSVYVPASFQRDDLLPYYEWECQQVRLFVEQNDLLTVPPDIAPLEVVETPPFLRSMVPGIAYNPAGPFDSEQVGTFFVRPIPKDLDRKQLEARFRFLHRRGFRGSVVHEGYPGHHLQMQIAAQNPSAVRKWQQNAMLVEGWALYSEEMMYEAGLYGEEDPAMWLAILGGIRFRAARIVADAKLHTGQFTYQECVDWMIDVLEAKSEGEKSYLRNSVRKYTLTPTIWMSYLMGKREIQMLREAAEQSDGILFSESDFYDKLLAEGSIPPALLWDIFGLERPDSEGSKTIK